jgi:two-component system, LytTR family, response regulator
MTLRALIVDDEPVARRGVRRLLARKSDIEIVGEAASGDEALDLIRSTKPDLVFLDIQMPVMTGLEVVRALESLPSIVFLTAHEEFAVQAFDLNAIDYLLKPIDPDRFALALERVRERRRGGTDDLEQRLRAVVEQLQPQPKYLERIPVKLPKRIVFVRTADLIWAVAEENYVRLHTEKSEYLIRMTLSALEEQLDPAQFLRIRRSAIVRLDAIREVQPLLNGIFRIVLTGGATLTSSRLYRKVLEQLLSNGR